MLITIGDKRVYKACHCPLENQWGQGSIKVAYYSFQKRKITFLKLYFKANRSFLLGYLLLQLLKEMILTLIILEKKYEKLTKYQT